ncbi:hypothetical protein [Mesomycoplasma lagogenitalium]|uniref:Uncharacterized protein n=1 Tax=Mesomycoplasma lagogenitalium TaxID=171286 RepID=A0ABY8LU19_9BACT|nr:hypothetical protein [Mesomycoplasma lagogenitalium]WGI36737.1 hypothetical protein QEG99_00405 [Mesomycoplasma lagogenitalium]
MKNKWQIKSSEELNLSFDFEILLHQERILDIKINKMLRNLKYDENYFNWFMEDLIFLLDENRYQRRWDYGTINIYNISNLNLSKENEKDFLNLFKSVTNFDLLAKE